MSRNFKRRITLAVIIYIMINCFAWGIMKAYINSHNCVSRDKLVMAQISDTENGKKVSVIGGSITIPDEKHRENDVYSSIKTLIPLKIRVAEEIFAEAAEKISE